MHRPSLVANGLARLIRGIRSYATDADIASARSYCLTQLQKSHHEAHLIHRFVPPPIQDAYAALRALNMELVRLPELVSKPIMGEMRIKFWQDSLDRTFSDDPPREPICVLLGQALRQLENRAGGDASRQSIKFWISRLVRTRQRYMDNRPFPNLAALEDYAENTYSTLIYATLAFIPLRSTQLDHLASHTPKGASAPSPRTPVLLLPLDVMSSAGVKEEDVFRSGPRAPGLQDAVFKVATRAHDHLLTAREMLARLTRGEDAGHECEHGVVEDDDVYGGGDDDVREGLRRCFGVFLEAIPAGVYLDALEKVNFDPWAVGSSGWRLPWRIWRALSKREL
ncbi:squalene/phytoene synthase [Ophiocordyceps camponoti-floridani]|uniref:Squalene/phytoene synthase n=1 Tax=Ophiocordyceps camponoti-floridani TaxID=2030778 RepID=A0A8H4VEX6_9HYPO|nr:squalene/phytoene synthase [Ophiocordyceps camponoti-floridani]